jgi:predicted RNase H-like nuclease
MAGGPLATRKKTWLVLCKRRQLLDGAGIGLAHDLGPAAEVAAVDDLLDAAAAAWTALRYVNSQATSLPGSSKVFSDGIACAIWA